MRKKVKKVADILKKFEKKTCQIAFHVVLLMSFPGVAQLGEEKCRLWRMKALLRGEETRSGTSAPSEVPRLCF